MSSLLFNEKTTAGLEGGGVDGLDSELYLFILDNRQLEAAVGSNELFISCHVLGSVDAMLRFIHAVGLLKLAVLVPVHACTQQIILVFVCGTYVPTLAYLWYLVVQKLTFLCLLKEQHDHLLLPFFNGTSSGWYEAPIKKG